MDSNTFHLEDEIKRLEDSVRWLKEDVERDMPVKHKNIIPRIDIIEGEMDAVFIISIIILCMVVVFWVISFSVHITQRENNMKRLERRLERIEAHVDPEQDIEKVKEYQNPKPQPVQKPGDQTWVWLYIILMLLSMRTN